MELYKVLFTFINHYGEEKEDFLDNNGQGFTLEEAQYVSTNLRQGNVVTITNVVIKSI